MNIEFYHRSPLQLTDDNVRTMVNLYPDVAKKGYVFDRLKPVTVERHGTAFWKYQIPVMQVAR